MVIIYNGLELIQRPARLIAYIMELRKKYGFKFSWLSFLIYRSSKILIPKYDSTGSR